MDSPRAATPRSQLGTAEHFRWLGGIVQVVLVLNLLDAIFTVTWTSAGSAREANPLLAGLVHDFPVVFTAAKLSLVGLGSLLLWRYRRRPLAIIAIFGAFLVYYALLLYHLGFLGLVLGIRWFP